MQTPTTPPIRPSAAAASQAGAAAATNAASRVPIAQGARRMPPVNRTQRTEFMDIPVYPAPTGSSHAEWPIIETYARLVWRADEFELTGNDLVDDEQEH
jgi:hypothetical protein